MSALPPPPLAQPQIRQSGRRAAARVRLGIPATIILIGGTLPCRLDDLSQTGARIALPALSPSSHPLPGNSGLLLVNGIEAFGTVIWATGGRLGLRFDERMTLDHVIAIRHFADTYAEHERSQRDRMVHEFVHGLRRHA